jgi:PAS domain S-box-containing protein
MNPDLCVSKEETARTDAEIAFADLIRRLVKGASELRAIDAGEVDAIIDPATGKAILLPKAQEALLERKAQYRSLVELSSDGYWEQDEHYRFVSYRGTAIGTAGIGGREGILGRTLWELSFDNMSEDEWETHRRQLEWRSSFRDLSLREVGGDGAVRGISISGEPMFDAQGQFKGYCGTVRDTAKGMQTEAVVPEAGGVVRAALEALAIPICVLDSTGTVIMTNQAWRAFTAANGGIGAGVSEGVSYLAACDAALGDERADGIAMAAGIRQVIAGGREIFRHEYAGSAPAGRGHFVATVTRLRGAGAAHAAVSCEDITALKHAERLLRLEYTVARCLADADDSSAALQAVIRAVCEAQQWDCGRHFRLDPVAGALHLDGSWGMPVAGVEQFMEKSRGAVFRPGAGLAGRVCQSGQPLWIASGSKDARALQTALEHETGMAGAFVLPVIADTETIGVLAFAGRTVHEPDDRLLQAMRSIGRQLGRFLQQRRAEDALRRSEARLRALIELSSDWTWEQDCDFRFTKLVGSGMAGAGDILGKALWELPSVVLSDDEWVKLKSELAARWSFCDFEYAVVRPDGQTGYYSISGEPVYDEAGAFLGFRGIGLEITRRKRAEIALREAGL